MEVAGAWAKALRVEPQEAQVLARLGQRLPGGLQDGGLEAGQLLQEGARGEHEDAAVPGVGAGLQVGGGGLRVGLLGEGVDGIGPGEAGERAHRGGCSRSRCAATSGVMPNSTSLPVRATSAARRTAATKPGSSSMTWSDGIRARMPAGSWRATSRAATAAAGAVLRATGSSTMALGVTPARSASSCDQEAVIVVAHDDGRGEARLGRQPLQRGGEEARGLAVEEADELLGIHGARQRPQPRARAARKNDRKNAVHAQSGPALRGAALAALQGAAQGKRCARVSAQAREARSRAAREWLPSALLQAVADGAQRAAGLGWRRGLRHRLGLAADRGDVTARRLARGHHRFARMRAGDPRRRPARRARPRRGRTGSWPRRTSPSAWPHPRPWPRTHCASGRRCLRGSLHRPPISATAR